VQVLARSEQRRREGLNRGGKGGGNSSNEQVENTISQVYNDQYRSLINQEKANNPDLWRSTYSPGGSGHGFYLKVFGPDSIHDFDPPKPAEEAKPEPVAEAAPVAAAPDPMANMPAAPATDPVLTPPASLPGAGDALGGAVLKPPRYWVGGIDQYENATRTGRGTTGAMKTTQT
jgi:hypothetical protein